MSTRNDHLILSTSITGFGHHPGAPHTEPQRLIDVAHYRDLLQTAERGLLDFVLLHDERAVPVDQPYGRLDALSILSRLAPETKHIGLAVSKPTTYSEPFTVSRELATLDFVSGGRAAWNVTTNASDIEAANYGQNTAPNADERRETVIEYVDVSRKLWDSWEDNAVIADRARGLYIDPNKLHHINHVGKHFKIRGPQITYRPLQGHVVVILEDHQDAGIPLNPEIADVLILQHNGFDAAKHDYRELKAQAAFAGRQVRILERVLPILGETEARAKAYAAQLDALTGNTNNLLANRFVGTPAQFADWIEQWFGGHALDGVHVLPAVLPDDLAGVVRDLVPILRRRGLFRNAYEGGTLRDRLGLTRPASQYVGALSDAHTAYFDF